MSLARSQARCIVRAGAVLLFAALLQSCGGGGEGDGGGGDGSGGRLRADTTNVTVAAEPGDSEPQKTVILTVTNLPKEKRLYHCVERTLSGITGVSSAWSRTVKNQIELFIGFRSPGRLADGIYEDRIEFQLGTDRDCSQRTIGGPVTINTHYTVSGGRVVDIDRDTIVVEADGQDPTPKREIIRVMLDEPAEGGFYVETEQTTNAISTVLAHPISQAQKDVEVTFKTGGALPTGAVNDTMTIRVCYFGTCEREVQGSPFSVSTQAKVKAHAEPDLIPMPYLSRVALAHDVVDAEFDRASNAIVMVSRFPSSAIHVYDVTTGLERSQDLPHPPTAVSLAPDGLTAAVGHNEFVSVVDVVSIGESDAPEPVLLNLSHDVFDLVLDGHGFVHVFPLQLNLTLSIEIATNTEMVGNGINRSSTRARLRPGGPWIYTADHDASGNIHKLDISSGVGMNPADSPYRGIYPMCGNLWLSQDGETIYTACGHTFSSSADQVQDMAYVGGMALTPSDFNNRWRIPSLSDSAQADEIALIEDDYPCHFMLEEFGPCYSHFALYERQSLAMLARYAFNLVSIDGFDYAQSGLYVFHDATNSRKYVIGRAVNSPDPRQDYFLSVVE
jgi:hypothetical protein